MNIHDSSTHLYTVIQHSSEQMIKSLNQQERKTVLLALSALQKKETSSSSKSASLTEIASITHKLNTLTTVSQERSSWLVQWGKAIGNFFHFRISCNQILNEIKQISSRANELKRIPDLIRLKKAELGEWTEMVRFQKEDAAPIYKDIKGFYDKLPRSLNEAKPLLNQKKIEIQELLEQAKAANKDPSYIHILKKELLPSLTKMDAYKGKQEDFERELKATQHVFGNAVKFCDDHQVAQKSIQNLTQEIQDLEKREQQLR